MHTTTPDQAPEPAGPPARPRPPLDAYGDLVTQARLVIDGNGW
jgi:hypothetical protein